MECYRSENRHARVLVAKGLSLLLWRGRHRYRHWRTQAQAMPILSTTAWPVRDVSVLEYDLSGLRTSVSEMNKEATNNVAMIISKGIVSELGVVLICAMPWWTREEKRSPGKIF